MSHNRNRQYTPLSELNHTTRANAPTGVVTNNVRNRDIDAYTGDPYQDAPQVLKARAEPKPRMENTTITESNGRVTMLLDVKSIKPTKSGTSVIYASAACKTATGVTINIMLTRKLEVNPPTGVRTENATFELLGKTQVRVIATPKYIGPSAPDKETGVSKTNLFVKCNGSFEIPGRGVFNITINGFKKPGV